MNIHNELKELGLTRRQFADEVGLSWRTIQEYATGKAPLLVRKYLALRLWMKRRGFKASDFPE